MVLFGVVVWRCGCDVAQSCTALSLTSDYLLIDAGHGGADNGASSAEGVTEDGINLAISLQLYDLMRFCGVPTRMTRTEDVVVTSNNNDAAKGWKTMDMHARLQLFENAALAVSIHQNHFSQSKYFGTQVFYGTKHEKSQLLADCIQTRVVSMLQPNNTRTIKAAGDTIFLLHRTTRPAVIVECGFLSNPEEAKALQNERYQQRMAFAVGCGILEYTAKG